MQVDGKPRRSPGTASEGRPGLVAGRQGDGLLLRWRAAARTSGCAAGPRARRAGSRGGRRGGVGGLVARWRVAGLPGRAGARSSPTSRRARAASGSRRCSEPGGRAGRRRGDHREGRRPALFGRGSARAERDPHRRRRDREQGSSIRRAPHLDRDARQRRAGLVAGRVGAGLRRRPRLQVVPVDATGKLTGPPRISTRRWPTRRRGAATPGAALPLRGRAASGERRSRRGADRGRCRGGTGPMSPPAARWSRRGGCGTAPPGAAPRRRRRGRGRRIRGVPRDRPRRRQGDRRLRGR